MFSIAGSGLHARDAHVLERMYHRGHALSWDGKEVLQSLIEEHGVPTLAASRREALGRVFAIILWGEFAAWRVGAQLADALDAHSARLAATSQAFDEARHFYVMHDYLAALDALPERLDLATERLLSRILDSHSLAHKLVGTQLLVEPIALTLFQVVRKLELEPVLSGLLPYFEKDEARHVALGVHLLPALLRRMSRVERALLWAFQVELLGLVGASTLGLNRDLATLGADPRAATSLAGARILHLMTRLEEQLDGEAYVPTEWMRRIGNLVAELVVPEKDGWQGTLERLRQAAKDGGPIVAAIEIPDPPEEAVPLMRRSS
jgi:hypothetical protein